MWFVGDNGGMLWLVLRVGGNEWKFFFLFDILVKIVWEVYFF